MGSRIEKREKIKTITKAKAIAIVNKSNNIK